MRGKQSFTDAGQLGLTVRALRVFDGRRLISHDGPTRTVGAADAGLQLVEVHVAACR
ncbi:hypothetical protein EMEDMD4_230057 [Sinorhizobium medicae]|uniref:Uncharacterized protein n=1 Tax=Sinorhizobium medicae TaxID=110321 RepID=A0A508WUH8_9HYPH|nr:hypothetical protein EMEDMD4_230057 [Sinorhizobium medicae]